MELLGAATDDAGTQLLGAAPDSTELLGAPVLVEAELTPPPPPAPVEKPSGDFQRRMTEAFKALQSAGQVAGAVKPGGPNEKRRVVRLKCSHRVQVRLEDRIVDAMVSDIGLGGLRLVLTESIEGGTMVALTSMELDAQEVKSKIVWCKPNVDLDIHEAGVQFQEDPELLGQSWVSSLLHTLGAEQRVFEGRKHIRALAGLVASAEISDGRLVEGSIQDLGLGGGQLMTEQPLPPQTSMKLQIGPYGDYDPLKLNAEVLNSRFDDEKKLWAQSLKFVKTPPAQLKLLGRYVVDLLKESAG